MTGVLFGVGTDEVGVDPNEVWLGLWFRLLFLVRGGVLRGVGWVGFGIVELFGDV